MLSVIKRRRELSDLFAEYSMIREVYANHDFEMDHDTGTFIILAKYDFDKTTLLYQMQKLFNMPIDFFVVTDPYSAIIKGNKIIWKENKWYL